MALVLKDRVKETSVSTGTGAITLAGTTGAYQPFSTIGDGNLTYYAIAGQTTTEWEVGYGTYTLSTNSISRDFIYSSSNSNTIVTFSAGTKDVFCTYPSEQAVYQEVDGSLKLIAGVIEVSLDGTHGTTLNNTAFQAFTTTNDFFQNNIQNLDNGSDASADYVATNDVGDDDKNYVDLGINSSGFTSVSFPIYTANSAYLYNQGDGVTHGDLFVGTGDIGDVVIHAGGFTSGDVVATIKSDTKNLLIGTTTDTGEKVQIAGSAIITGAAEFGDTVLLSTNPSTALQAATKQYVDNAVSTGIHIHEQVYAETSAALAAVYTQGGTTDTITTITNTNTVTLASATPSLNDELWLYTSAGNGLSTNTGYFVEEIVSPGVVKLSLIPGGAPITGLTNAAGLTYAVRINSGVGAYLESSANATFAISGVTGLTTGQRILVYNQSTGYWNGVYTITSMGSAGSKWKLTRATDQNMYEPSNVYGMGAGDYFFITTVTEAYVLTTTDVIIIGYTSLTYTLFSAATVYTGTAPVVVTGSVISLNTVPATSGGTGTATVTTGDLLYGSATDTWSKLPKGTAYQSLLMDASGINVQWNALALNQSSAVSGTLGATNGGTGTNNYAIGDTLYSSAANTISKLSGNTSTTKQYLSQTGTGAVSTAPSWATISAADIGAGTLPATRGGTDQSSYSIGDILYADTTTSLARLADVATGNALISGGLNVAPSWGKLALASAVSGTLGVANGGTGVTTSTGSGNVVLSTSPTLVTPVLGTPTSGNFSTGTFTWPTFNQNTTGTASNVTGTVAVLNGGTGATTVQAAINALAGATTSGSYLRGNGTNVVMSTIVAGDVPTLNQNTTGTASNVTGTVAVLNGGTGSTTNSGARTNLGATTVGSNFFTLTNPTAVTFPRMNADNTVSSLDAATFRTAIGAGTSSTTGTVTSVSGTAPIAVATGTTTPAISIAQATTSTSGYLSSTDWNTFNGKQAAGSYVTVNGALGTPSSGTLTNCTFPTLNQNTTGSSGSCTGNAATATNASQLNSLTKVQMWNNSGQNHSTYQSFGAIPDFGVWFMQNSAAGDVPQSGQFYTNSVGLGNDYAYSQYAMQTAVLRNTTNPYQWIRYKEATSWGAWTKTAAGYADTAGSSASCSGNAATATTATNQSGGTVSATTGTFSGDIVRSGITAGSIYLTGSLPGYAANSYPTLRATAELYFSANAAYSGYFSGANFYALGTVQGTNITSGGNVTGSSTSCTGNAATATTATNFAGIPAGTVMLFVQTAAPTGWTKSTTHDNKALRIVSGTASSGGSVAFTTAFASQAVSGSVAVTVSAGTLATGIGTLADGAVTLATTQIPSHTHPTFTNVSASNGSGVKAAGLTPLAQGYPMTNSGATGGGTSHTHGLSGSPSLSGSPAVTGQTFTGTAINLAVSYVDAIIATKN